METTVYGDILFLVNFCMDFQALFLTAKLLHRRFSVVRGVIFSALGAIYALAALFFSTSGILALAADLSVCFLMCLGTYYEKEGGVARVIFPFFLYFGVSFAIGGAMSGLSSLLSHVEVPIGVENQESGISFALLAAAGGVIAFLWGRFQNARIKGKSATLYAEYGGCRAHFSCVVDTGNLLHDPVGGRPVALISKKGAAALFPPELVAVAERGDPTGLSELPHSLAERVRLIPASTVFGRGILFAIAPDRAMLDMGRGAYQVELLLAPSPAEGPDFEVLLPAELAAV